MSDAGITLASESYDAAYTLSVPYFAPVRAFFFATRTASFRIVAFK